VVKRRFLSILVLAVLIGSLLSAFVPSPVLADDPFESYTTGDDQYYYTYTTNWRAQVFTASDNYTITSVKLFLYRTADDPGTLYASIRNVASDKPTGGDLCVGNRSATDLPTGSPYMWATFTFSSGYGLTEGVQYAIVFRAPSGTGTSCAAKIRYDDTAASYSGGDLCLSNDGGSGWTAYSGDDALFETYGEGGTPNEPTMDTLSASSIGETYALLNGEILNIGNSTVTQRGFQYYDIDVDSLWEHAWNETGSYGIGTFSHNLTSLIPGHTYYYRAYGVNGAGTSYGDSVSFQCTYQGVGMSNTYDVLIYSGQRKVFYFGGRHWVFYSEDVNYGYKSSVDGITWSSYEIVEATGGAGWEFSLYHDNTFIHYAYTYAEKMYYRKGLLRTDGSITWLAAHQLVITATGEVLHPTIAVDSGGYPFIGYYEGGLNLPYVTKSSTNDGTWVTASGFPYNIKNWGDNGWGVFVVPLTNGKVYAVYSKDAEYVRGKLWNGASWGSEEVISSQTVPYYCHLSATSYGDSVCVAYAMTASSQDLMYRERPASGIWYAEVTLLDGLPGISSPILSLWNDSGDLRVFWVDEYADYVYYKARTNGAWQSTVSWIDTSEAGVNIADDLSGASRESNGYVGMAYSANTVPPYIVKYAYLQANLPTVTTVDTADITSTSASLQGYLVDDQGEVCAVRFEWGTTVSYGSQTAWQSGKHSAEYFSASVTGLLPNTTYYYRAQAKLPDGSIGSGDGKYFTTVSYGTPSVSTGTAAGVSQSSATIQGSVSSMGDYSTVYVSFQWGLTVGYEQSPTAEQTKTSMGGFSAYLSGLSPGTVYYYRAVLRYGSTTIYGSQGTFTTTAAGGAPGIDPPDILRIDDVKVFSGYFEDNDQLYVINYRAVYTVGDPSTDVGDYFDFVLLDGALIRAKVPVSSWGYRPGSIYLKVSSALLWGEDYTVRLIGNIQKWPSPPFSDYTLSAGDWLGDDLKQLDSWVVALGKSIGTFYDVQLVDYAQGVPYLNEQGTAVFSMGIPGLCQVRPNLCSSYVSYPGIPTEQNEVPVIDTEAETGSVIYGFLEDVADFFNMDNPSEVGGILFGGGFFLVGILLTILLGSAGQMAGLAGMGIASPILIYGAKLGVIPMQLVIIIAAITVVYVLVIVWLKGQ
jgi:hypothetical protein